MATAWIASPGVSRVSTSALIFLPARCISTRLNSIVFDSSTAVAGSVASDETRSTTTSGATSADGTDSSEASAVTSPASASCAHRGAGTCPTSSALINRMVRPLRATGRHAICDHPRDSGFPIISDPSYPGPRAIGRVDERRSDSAIYRGGIRPICDSLLPRFASRLLV